MFQLLPCSRCQRTCSVRSEVSEQALLKCPNCGNQFRLGELLDAFYAPWQILENPGVPASGTTVMAAPAATALAADGDLATDHLTLGSSAAEDAGPTVVSTTAHEESGLSLDGPDLELADEDEESGAGVSLDGVAEDKPKADWSTFKPITHEEFQRLKRADRSPIWSTLQVVLGGAAAIPVSLLLIWYVLGKDVAGAGPAVAQYVPWIVPEKFRGYRPSEPSFQPNSSPQTATQTAPQRGQSGFRKFDDVMPPAEDAETADSAKQDEAAASDGTVVGTLAEPEEQSQPPEAEPVAEGTQTPADNATDNAIDNAAAPESAADQPMANVFALLKRTKDKVDGWKEAATAQDNVKRAAALALVDDLTSLGVHLSSIPDMPGAPALARDKAQEICRAIKRQSDLVKVLHDAARAQLKGKLPRSKEGWVLVCTVGEILDQADAWRIMVADSDLLPLDVPKIEIPKSVAPQLTSGQQLLLLGKFVAPPGTETQVAQSAVVESRPDDAAPAENSEQPAPGTETFRASFSYGL